MEQLDFVVTEERNDKLRNRLTKKNNNDKKQKVKKKSSSNLSSKTGAKNSKKSVFSREGYQRLNVEIPKDLHKELKVQAIIEERSVTDIVLEAINHYMDSAK